MYIITGTGRKLTILFQIWQREEWADQWRHWCGVSDNGGRNPEPCPAGREETEWHRQYRPDQNVIYCFVSRNETEWHRQYQPVQNMIYCFVWEGNLFQKDKLYSDRLMNIPAYVFHCSNFWEYIVRHFLSFRLKNVMHICCFQVEDKGSFMS